MSSYWRRWKRTNRCLLFTSLYNLRSLKRLLLGRCASLSSSLTIKHLLGKRSPIYGFRVRLLQTKCHTDNSSDMSFGSINSNVQTQLFTDTTNKLQTFLPIWTTTTNINLEPSC